MIQTALKILCLGILVLMLGIPSLAQNTKGDRPVPANRETRFKTPKKAKTRTQPARRVRRGDDQPSRNTSVPPPRRRERERPGKPVTPQFSRSKPQDRQKPWKGDITGRRVRPHRESSRAKNVYPQPETTGYSSRTLRRTKRANENPNVRRVQRMQDSESARAKVGRPIRPTFHKTRPQKSERAWTGDITGRKIRSNRTPRVGSGEQGTAARMMGSRAQRGQRFSGVPTRVSGRARNVYSKNSFYVNNQSRLRARNGNQRNGAGFNILGSYQHRQNAAGKRGKRVTPRSASSAYISRRSTNAWAQFPRAKRKQERAYLRDLAGKKLRTKNFESQRPELMNPTMKYQRRNATGERPYEGPAAGGHLSRTGNGRAWNGDIAHRNIRGGFRSKKGEPRPGSALFGRGPRTGRVDQYQGTIKAGRRGFGNQGEAFTGNIRSGRPLRGGGSVSGSWNNKGTPIQRRIPGKGAGAIGYSGNIKRGRVLNDQGEEYTGNIRQGRRGFNDQGEEYSGNIRSGKRGFSDQGEEYTGNIRTGRRGFSDQGEEYTGNIKSGRPLKGGGSRSGRHWNNNNTPILVRVPKGKHAAVAGYQGNIKGQRTFQDQGEEYRGNIRGGKPLSGGGSVSGKLWNNNGRAIEGKAYVGQTKISRYSGDVRARRPEKGGGSVSGKLWNNNEQAIEGKAYVGQTKISRYSGNIRAKRPEKGGGSVSGQLWNNNEKAIAVRPPKQSEERNFKGDLKVSRGSYARNPNSADGSLPHLKASATAVKAGQHTRGVRRDWDYIKNPSAADEAQRTREPGRAFGQSTAFQGNIRLKKFDLFGKSDLHPDARFVKLNKNNVDEEKDMLTNFKLWWARLFRKAETQPDHLKEKDNDHKPRYDKGEAGMWYE